MTLTTIKSLIFVLGTYFGGFLGSTKLCIEVSKYKKHVLIKQLMHMCTLFGTLAHKLKSHRNRIFQDKP